MRRLACLLLLAGAVSAAPLLAQSTPTTVAAGARVRLEGPRVSGVYTVLRATTDSLVLTRPGETASLGVPMAAVRRLDVSRGRRSTGAGFGRGLMMGAAVGGLTGVVMGLADCDDPQGGWFAMSAGQKAGLAGIVVGAAGAVVGGVIGAVKPGEQWTRVALTPTVGVGPGEPRSVAVGLSRAF